ncbi:putative transcription factor WD40-like family [Helianthus annuus]|nr:putative transcription factor WD40-like family [Helianthus annuus]
MARPLNEEFIGSKGVKKVEFVRIITEALYSLGYNKTAAYLEHESGVPCHSSKVTLFIQQILDGCWDESLASLHKIGLADETSVKLACFIILQQKFLELLDGEKVMDALKTLRAEIAPLSVNTNRARSELLEDLQKLFPSTVMISEKRLLQLVEQALDLQRVNCLFHNSLNEETSLNADHRCGRDNIPSKTVQILHDHRNEVWYLKFSKNGKYLDSSSSDHSAIIWEILTCGVEEVIRRWDVSSGECLHVYEKRLVGTVSCSWSPDGKYIFTGLTDKSVTIWDLDGKEVDRLEGQKTIKISDLQMTNDGKLVTVFKDNTILILDRESGAEKWIKEDETIISFTLSEDNKLLLVSLVNEELRLWSIEGQIGLISKYRGHKRSRFIVRACFGGVQQAFIASGSEDSQVYIWHKRSGELIETLGGHSGAVNCVSWNPVDPHMLASASDDRTIRIWGLNHVDTKSNSCISYCNGSSSETHTHN